MSIINQDFIPKTLKAKATVKTSKTEKENNDTGDELQLTGFLQLTFNKFSFLIRNFFLHSFCIRLSLFSANNNINVMCARV